MKRTTLPWAAAATLALFAPLPAASKKGGVSIPQPAQWVQDCTVAQVSLQLWGGLRFSCFGPPPQRLGEAPSAEAARAQRYRLASREEDMVIAAFRFLADAHAAGRPVRIESAGELGPDKALTPVSVGTGRAATPAPTPPR
jgi:hypothetical protein